MPLTSKGRTDIYIYIYKDGRKGRRTRPPDRNGDATRTGDHEKVRDQSSRSESCTPAFPFPVQDACGLRDGRRRIRKGDASGAARLEQSHGRAARGGSSPPQRSATPFCQRLSKEVRTAFIFRDRMAAGTSVPLLPQLSRASVTAVLAFHFRARVCEASDHSEESTCPH